MSVGRSAASSVAFAWRKEEVAGSELRFQFGKKLKLQETRNIGAFSPPPSTPVANINTRFSRHQSTPLHARSSPWPTSLNLPSLWTPSPSRPRVVMPPQTLLPPPTPARLSPSSTIQRTSTSSTLSPTPGLSGSQSPQVERYLTSQPRHAATLS